ncbi:hypothetical protein PybrP1_003575 [[Pythium] brassicae (nom. inval.)]|nr:hypothetical protein PybrP1_003575 [[Pythium] brassicae (nom. inval.)]
MSNLEQPPSARRSARERKRPKQIYAVLDLRPSSSRSSSDGANAGGNDSDNDNDNQDDDDMDLDESESRSESDEEEEADERQFVSPKPKPKPRTRPSAAAGAPRPRVAKRKPSTLVRPRKLKPVQEEGAAQRKGSDATDTSDSGDAVFFEATKRGNVSLRNLMAEWRDRYEENAEEATREVLNFVLQKLEKVDMSDLVDYVVEDLVQSNEEYPIASRLKTFKHFQKNFVEFWDAFVTECFESELLFTSTVVHQFVDWCSTLSREMFERRLQQLVQVVNIVFTGVVVHRYRDVMPEIRSESARTIGRWISALPDHFLKDNYLKYLGWLLNDKEASVRRRVVLVLRSLYEKEEFTDKLELFTSRFLPRYLELCNDSVEKLVFELDHADIRKAAAEFVCLQYDAFGVPATTENVKLKRDQLNTQAIALVEFAEEYIYNHGALPEYQSDMEKLALMVELIPMLSLSAEIAIQHLLQAEHEVVKRETEVTIREIAQEVMDQLEQSVEGDARVLESSHDENYLPSELSSATGDKVLHRAEDGSTSVKRVERMEKFRQADTIKHALLVLYLDLLWLTKAVFKDVEERNKHKTVLEDCFVSVLEMHLEKTQRSGDEDSEEKGGEVQPAEMEEIEFENEQVVTFVKEAQRAAFLTFCDTRCLFVEKFEDATPPFDALHWPLPRILVLLTQMYFENEMETADADEPERENGVEEREPRAGASEADQFRKAELLAALGKVSISNPSNRRQSAAVLRYFTENAKASVEVVKAFSRHVKNETPVRYLEVQMTALRQQFNSILALKDELQALSCSKEDEDARQELHESVEVSEAQLKELAKKLSQSLGVGKITPALRAPFFRFLCEGVRYSLERREQFVFLEPLRSYLGHLDPSSMKQLRGYLMQLLEEKNETPESEDELSQEWRIVFDFLSAISAKKKERQTPASTPTAAASVEPLEPAGASENPSVNGDGGEESAAESMKRKRSLEMEHNDKSSKDDTETSRVAGEDRGEDR